MSSIEEKRNQELPNLRGRLFRVEERKKENSPTHFGRCKIEGQEYYMSAWVAEAIESKKKYFSLSFSKVEVKDEIAQDVDVLDDDIPF